MSQTPLCLPAVRGKSAPRLMRLTTPSTSPMAMAATNHFKGDRGTPFGQSPIVRALTRDYLRGHTTPQLNASSLPYPRTAAQVRHCLLSGPHHPSAERVLAALPTHSGPGEALSGVRAPAGSLIHRCTKQLQDLWRAQQAFL